MPTPGPLGRLARRRRLELDLTQKEVNERTRAFGFEFGQNNISRLESGISHRVNDVDRLTALAKALEFENDREFILTAFGPKDLPLPPPAFADPEHIVRVLVISFDLSSKETEKLRRFVTHVYETVSTTGEPTPEERIAGYARELVAQRRSLPVKTKH
jgi:transcriptional regulator with XRE-family HTH domain